MNARPFKTAYELQDMIVELIWTRLRRRQSHEEPKEDSATEAKDTKAL